ncbi:head GIN domain-containing protein [Winogradskyella bathintestinalis]|uniref:Head GIN domain-containing protein n=1 Tax=Winogradskyella bathintestinalis TaxID=3035208 RepID=A0ABT7ZXZ9_9FLAO|nr:head GIN domain-containing protein [Winogradskyella bathintestinalis]MDN3493875.1 head GIN domain-containing protein [Winogradskyella bathintestinalis]
MKKVLYIFCLIIFACNSEDVYDCFQTSGEIIYQEISVTSFEKIFVNRDIELIIKDAPDYKVTIETGENLINDVEVEVIDNELVLTDNNSCNYVREYGITKIYVEAPNINVIRTSSQYSVSSDGILYYPALNLYSEDFNAENEFTVGDFRLHIASENLEVVSNNLSFFYIDGNVENLFVGFYSGAGRFEGENLRAEHVQVYHRGSNDMVVNPQQSLTGELRGTGNLISVNQPAVVDVERIYSGELLFE